MSIGEILVTKRAKILMGYIYGWGASIVMIGALFKLQHWPHSGFFLTLGLLTEAVIFFVSAFEPPLETPEWSKVYPQLKEDYEMSSYEEIGEKDTIQKLLGSSGITSELLSNVGESLSELSNTARGISDISSATLATNLYVQNLSSASESMNNLAQTNNMVNKSIHDSFSLLSNTYSSSAQQLSESSKQIIDKLNRSGEEFSLKLSESGSLLTNSLKKGADTLSSDITSLNDRTKQYSENLDKLNKSLHHMQEAFDSQIKGSADQFRVSQKFSSDLENMNQILATSLEELKKYKSNAEQLNRHLEALNTIYGNMLGAMNYKK